MAVPDIFSKNRRSLRVGRLLRAAMRDPETQFLRRHMAEDIVDRLDFIRATPERASIAGDSSGVLKAWLAAHGTEVSDHAWQDEELPWKDGNFGFIGSIAQLDTVNDLPGALIHIRKALAPGGLFVATFCGAGSVPALRQILLAADRDRPAGRIHPQIDNRAASALMARAGFSRHVVDTHELTVHYRSLDRLLADLRGQGLANVLADAPPPLTRTSLARAYAAFAEMADSEGRVPETFAILTLTGWR
ncbi:MAG: class I SAM-dependent methyltransferase [Alteraurantiacibacter sp.]|nr:class I SAM-dependent methyltransferase [Alteraurantiacibacter sp.]